MNAAKFTLTSTILAVALGLGLSLWAAPAQALCKDGSEPPCGGGGGGGGGNVSNPDDFQAVCAELFNDGTVGTCNCSFDVNVGVVIGNPVMKISLVENCETDTMLVLPNFVVSDSLNFPPIFDNCGMDSEPDCPPVDTNTFLDGRGFTLTAVDDFSDDAVITNSTDHGEIVDITIAIAATSAGCDGTPKSAINIDPDGKPAIHDDPVHTWILILGTKVMVTGAGTPLCNAIVMQNDLDTARTMIVHDSIVEPEAYTNVGTLFRDLRMFDLDSLVNIGVGSSTIGRPVPPPLPEAMPGTAVVFDNVDRGLIDHNIIENEMGDGTDVLGTGVLLQGSLTTEFTIKNNTIKGGDVGIQVGPDTDGLITKNTIVGDGDEDDGSDAVGILCDGGPNADIIIRKNNKVIGYNTLIDC